MQQNDIANESRQTSKFFGFFEVSSKIIFWYVVTAFFVILLGIYLGNALFGDRSLRVLNNLKDEKAKLITDIQNLKDENSKLQKKYLENLILEAEIKK